MNHRNSRPVGIYPNKLARYLRTTSSNVEKVANELGIERWSLELLGREGERVPLSIDDAARIIAAIRARQGLKFIRQHR